MDIRECYKKEMASIKHNRALDEKILNIVEGAAGQENETLEALSDKRRTRVLTQDANLNKVVYRANEIWKRRVVGNASFKAVVVAMVCMAVIVLHFDAIVGYGEILVGRFSLMLGGEEMKLSEMTPIEVDLEKHIGYEKTQMLDGESYWCLYENQDLLEEYTGIVLSDSANIELKDIMVNISTAYKTGHLSLEILCDVGQFHMNGMFFTDRYGQEEYGYDEYGYGEEYRWYYVYEYAEGKKAYFVREGGADKMQRVYFCERGIMYQLFVENSKEGKEMGMQVVDYMVE